MNAFSIAVARCGLSLAEAAELLGVRPDTVKSWSSGRREGGASEDVVRELRAYYRNIQEAADAIRLEILDLAYRRQPSNFAIGIPLAVDDRDAAKRSLRFASAYAAAVGHAIMDLPAKFDVTDVLCEPVPEEAAVVLLSSQKPPRPGSPWGGREILRAWQDG